MGATGRLLRTASGRGVARPRSAEVRLEGRLVPSARVKEASRYESLRDYLRVLRDRWRVVAALTLLGAAVALAMSLREDDVYEATSSISFSSDVQELTKIGSATPGVGAPPEQTPQARAQTLAKPAVVREVHGLLPEPRPSPAALQAAVTTSLDEESFLVRVTATWSDGEMAAELSNLFSQVAARQVNAEARREFGVSQRAVSERIDNLGRNPADRAELGVLIQQLNLLRFLSRNAKPATLVETAQTPGEPVSPKPLRNTLLGGLLGLVIGLLVAFVRDALDRRFRDGAEVERELGAPLVGQVREELMGRVISGLGGLAGGPAEAEGFRILRRNVEALVDDSPSGVVVVTSAMPEEGKSTVSGSLACASTASGSSTLLVECDLRRPSLATRMGLRPSPGVTEYLAGSAPYEDIFQYLRVEGPGLAGEVGAGGSSHTLTVVAAGAPSLQPAELLHLPRMREFIETVGSHYDLVVVDTSPLLPVADTLELLPPADCVLLCVRAGGTTLEQARAARATLTRLGSSPAGLVVTGIRSRDAPYYGDYSSRATLRVAPAGP